MTHPIEPVHRVLAVGDPDRKPQTYQPKKPIPQGFREMLAAAVKTVVYTVPKEGA